MATTRITMTKLGMSATRLSGRNEGSILRSTVVIFVRTSANDAEGLLFTAPPVTWPSTGRNLADSHYPRERHVKRLFRSRLRSFPAYSRPCRGWVRARIGHGHGFHRWGWGGFRLLRRLKCGRVILRSSERPPPRGRQFLKLLNDAPPEGAV